MRSLVNSVPKPWTGDRGTSISDRAESELAVPGKRAAVTILAATGVSPGLINLIHQAVDKCNETNRKINNKYNISRLIITQQ